MKLHCPARIFVHSHPMEGIFARLHAMPQFVGFGVWRYPAAYGPLGSGWFAKVNELSVPDWFLLILLSILPVVRRARKHLPTTAGLCHVCGYDLRSSTDRCPECGTPVPAKATA